MPVAAVPPVLVMMQLPAGGEDPPLAPPEVPPVTPGVAVEQPEGPPHPTDPITNTTIIAASSNFAFVIREPPTQRNIPANCTMRRKISFLRDSRSKVMCWQRYECHATT